MKLRRHSLDVEIMQSGNQETLAKRLRKGDEQNIKYQMTNS